MGIVTAVVWKSGKCRKHLSTSSLLWQALHLLLLAGIVSSLVSSLPIAIVLDDHASCGRGERLAAALAKERLSEGGGDATAHLDLEIFELPEDNDYLATETVCQVLPKGVAAILGPSSSPASAAIISHVCGEKEIPHVKLGPEGNTPVQSPRGSSVNLFPSPADISRAVASLLTAFNHSICSLLCTQTDCLLRHEELMRRFPISREGFSVRLVPEGADPTPLLKEIREDKISTIIIDASAPRALAILHTAAGLRMLSTYYRYILTTLDFSLLHLEGQLQGYPRILGFSLYDEKHPFYPEFSRSLNLSQHSACPIWQLRSTPQLKAGLLFDALHGVVRAARALNRSQALAVQPLSCSSTRVWYHGTSLLNYLRMVEYNGLTGRVEFDSRGQRSNYSLRVLQLRRDGLKEIGKWHSQKGLTLDTVFPTAGPSTSLVNRTLIVTSIVENPYLMLKENHKQLRGNDRYQGFCVDLLQEIAAILRFRYAIRLVSDGIYGAPEPNGSWTGLVGELIQGKADLAVASFTITAEREKVIDFSKPFMTLGISILYRVHVARKPGYFSFLDPFSPAVWLFMLLAYLAVSCILFLVARLTPYEWYNPYPCLRAGPSGGRLAVNQYTLGNSLWFPIGGFMQQGSEIMPRALSTRCISGVWWTFTLIIVSSYTANLAAFLTVQRMEVPVESVEDLADQTNIEYGTLQAGSTMTFFQTSRYQTYQRMWNFMVSKQPGVFVRTTEEGIARVLNSKYAFLLESTMNEYHRQRNCNLTQIGGQLDTKGYGIGMPLGSPYRDDITLAILQLQERNRIEILKRKWWEGGRCPREEDHRAKGLGMQNIGGIFVVLLCGLILAVVIAVAEFAWNSRRAPARADAELLVELCRSLSCSESSRRRPRTRPPFPPPPRPPGPPRRHHHHTITADTDPGAMQRLGNGKLLMGAGEASGGDSSQFGAPCTHLRSCWQCRQHYRFRGASATIQALGSGRSPLQPHKSSPNTPTAAATPVSIAPLPPPPPPLSHHATCHRPPSGQRHTEQSLL